MASDLDGVTTMAGAARNLGLLATTRADGTVHASLVSAGLGVDPVTGNPAVGIVVRGDAVKLRHLRRTGHATVTFQDGYQWVAVDGPVRIAGPDDPLDGISDDQLPDLLRAVFVAAGGSHEDWAEFDRVMAAERRTAVFVDPARIITNG